MYTDSSRKFLFALLVVVFVCPVLVAQDYLEEFTYATGNGGYSTGRFLSTSPISWKCGVPEIGMCPSEPPRSPTWGWPYSWGTASNPVGPQNSISGSYAARENSYCVSPQINLGAYGSGTPILRWTDYINIGTGAKAMIDVSNNNGMTWTNAYTGTGNLSYYDSWRVGNSLVLSTDFATSMFRIRFAISSWYAPAVYQKGFYFDNVSLTIPGEDQTPTVVHSNTEDGSYLNWPGPPDEDITVKTNTYDGNVLSLNFPASMNMFLAGEVYTGGFYAPSFDDYYDAEDYGIPNYEDVTDLVAYDVGLDESLTFGMPVRMLIPGHAGKKVGWYDYDNDLFHEIPTELPGDDGSFLESLGVDEGYCFVDDDGDGLFDDLAIWTMHCSYYITYVPEPTGLVIMVVGATAMIGRRR